MKFSALTQNEMPMTIGRLKSKPEVVITQPWNDIFTNLGTVTDIDLLRTRALSNRNPKLIRDVNGRHLENFNNVITMSPMVQFTKKIETRSSIPIRLLFVFTKP